MPSIQWLLLRPPTMPVQGHLSSVFPINFVVYWLVGWLVIPPSCDAMDSSIGIIDHAAGYELNRSYRTSIRFISYSSISVTA